MSNENLMWMMFENRVVRYIVGNKCETQAIFELRCTLAPRQTMKKIIRNSIIVLSKTIHTGRLQKSSGKIDYIVSKSAFRFARNLKETLNCVREFRQLNPPVGVYFKKENIDTLDATGELLMTVISVLAQDEGFNTTGNIDKAFRTEDGELDLERLLGHKPGENG